MSAAASSNLPRQLSEAQAIFYDGIEAWAPVSAHTMAERAEHLTAAVSFALEQTSAMRRLQPATAGVRSAPSVTALLPQILDGALTLTGDEFGNLRLVDPVTHSLRLVTQSGLSEEYVERFTVVDDESTVCARALRGQRQVVVEDFQTHPDFAAHRAAAVAANVRGVESTPLLDFAGRPLGVVSTMSSSPRVPDALDLRLTELLADVAGDRLSTLLELERSPADGEAAERYGDESHATSVARMVISALLTAAAAEPYTAAGADGPSPDGMRPTQTMRAPIGDLAEIVDILVTDLFRIALTLDGARSVATDQFVLDRMSAASRDVDQLIQRVRAVLASRLN